MSPSVLTIGHSKAGQPPARTSRFRTFANAYFGTGDNVWRKKP